MDGFFARGSTRVVASIAQHDEHLVLIGSTREVVETVRDRVVERRPSTGGDAAFEPGQQR
jgi:hypothetical protein